MVKIKVIIVLLLGDFIEDLKEWNRIMPLIYIMEIRYVKSDGQ